jgi:hypothetical protein
MDRGREKDHRLPIFRSNKAFDIARNAKAFLNLKSSITRGAASEVERSEDQAESSERARRPTSEQRKRLKEQLSQLKAELRATEDQAGRPGPLEGRKIRKEIFRLKNELRAARDRTEGEEPATGALPDFLIIGAQKCGTTSLYHLLTQHPYVEPAAFKELHFFDFDSIFDEGIEWYRQCFPAPKWKDGRRTITGEGTPAYLFYPSVPGRMAKVIPRAQLIALLRNPADRAYSHYQQVARKGEETRTFEEAIGAGKKTWLLGKEGEASEGADRADLDGDSEYLSRGVYVDQLLRWSEFFREEQILVLKSEDFFERPKETLKVVLNFLGLPDWEPEAWEIRKKGRYERGMDPATRRRLEEYFEPHNRRLYEFLGRDLGW